MRLGIWGWQVGSKKIQVPSSHDHDYGTPASFLYLVLLHDY
ncbi:hypothetical protein [Paenibacillus odorifer]|nr:hypothetical protein [Paenibacillus odorifer]